MNCETRANIQYVLYLDADEAKWLKGLMQNPFNGVEPCDELFTDSANRLAFWNALSEVEL